MSASRQRVVDLPRLWKRAVATVSDISGLSASLWFTYCLRYETFYLPRSAAEFWLAWVLPVAMAFSAFLLLSLYKSVVRFISLRGLVVMGVGALLATIVHTVAMIAIYDHCPPSVPLLFFMMAFVAVAGSRGLFILWFTHGQRYEREKVIIYGVGPGGISLITALNQSQQFLPVALVDDEPRLQHSIIHGLYVFAPRELRRLIEEFDVTRVLLSIEGLSRPARAEILRRLEPLAVRVQTVPSMTDVLAGRARISDVRDIDFDDLLGRDQIQPDTVLMARCIRDRVVMVTGAGGSIGSELCRQIIAQQPRRLVLLDVSEAALYQIEQELHQALGDLARPDMLVPLIGNVLDQQRLESIFKAYGVHTVYHAAAYKHVPLVEQNLVEGVRNNVLGTWRAAEAALSAGVASFVLVSTDKAVRPTNVMGASKRLAELVLQALASRQSATRFCMVRFGNVLGSSGSVVPLFQQQIQQGGPVTVTHMDVIRYFMSIPEAAQLVIQAGSMGQGGEVFLLDMGEPVRIADLARRMIHLMGHSVREGEHGEGDIEIVYTGLRPGEKLYEELLIGENPEGTEHPRILMANEQRLTWAEMQPLLVAIERGCEAFDSAAVMGLLHQAPTGYRPNAKPVDLVADQQASIGLAANVVPLTGFR
jgi:FlaA1/EpsC-like NDP-sugar epimerase